MPLDQRTIDALASAIVERLRNQEPGLLNRRQLASRLGIGTRTVSTLVARKELPEPLILGGVRRWDWAEVIAYLKVRRQRKPSRGRGIYDRTRVATNEEDE